jgi:exopolysaccharide production protein ExoZ
MPSNINLTKQEQIVPIQILRALAALGVIWQHIRYDFQIELGISNFPPTINVLNSGVDIFFVISGFIIVYSSSSLFQKRGAWREFITRRIIRIVPLYWLTSLLALAYILIRHRDSDILPTEVFRNWVISSFLFIPHARTNGEMSPLNGVGWTLNYEMFFYAFFAIALYLSPRRAFASITILFAILIWAGNYSGLSLSPSLTFLCNPRILEFSFGMLLSLAFQGGIRIPTWLTCALVLLGIVESSLVGFFGLSIFKSPTYEIASTFLQWGIPSALIVSGLALRDGLIPARQTWPVARLFCFIGEASYSIYLMHPFTITFIRFIYFHPHSNGMIPPQQPWVYVTLQFVFAVAAGVLTHIAIEKPLINIFRGITRRTRFRTSPKSECA